MLYQLPVVGSMHGHQLRHEISVLKLGLTQLVSELMKMYNSKQGHPRRCYMYHAAKMCYLKLMQLTCP